MGRVALGTLAAVAGVAALSQTIWARCPAARLLPDRATVLTCSFAMQRQNLTATMARPEMRPLLDRLTDWFGQSPEDMGRDGAWASWRTDDFRAFVRWQDSTLEYEWIEL